MEPFAESPPRRAAAIVIATGASPGTEPTLATEMVRGRSLLADILDRLAGLDLIVVVVRDEAGISVQETAANVVFIIDPEWVEGTAAPLRAGLDLLARDGDIDEAFVVPLAVPEIDPAVLEAVARGRIEAGTPVAVPKYRYVRGGPVLLAREIWEWFLGAEGDLDVEAVLLAHPQWVAEVRVNRAPPRRIASADDLLELA